MTKLSIKPNVSIIIRTKNEERWITQCLNAVLSQDYDDYEVVIVDNESHDKTVEKVRQFRDKFKKGLKILTCQGYLPGKALNIGIRESRGNFIVCLSGHCIPVNNEWLINLMHILRTKEGNGIAGVYGRQQPMSFTSDSDKRDLTLLFGLDPRIQIKDSFFHNANSVIKREVWDKIPFDEEVTNIEDRLWAKKVIENGYKIAYTPEASVYHYHGIHQNGDSNRCRNVVRILEKLHGDYNSKPIEITKLNIVSIIPVRGGIKYLNNKPLIEYTVKRSIASKYIKKTIVSTDNKEIADFAKKLGAEAPFIRDPYFSREDIDLDKVFSYSLKKLEENKIFPDLVVSLEATFPFRTEDLIDNMIAELSGRGLDSIVAAKRENKGLWKERRDRNMELLDEGLTPRKFKDPTLIELRGVGAVTHPEFLRKGEFFGEKLGLYEIDNPYSQIEVRSEEDFRMASSIIREWFA